MKIVRNWFSEWDVLINDRGLRDVTKLLGPGHAKTCFMPYANNKGADQTAQMRSLISAFIVRCLDSIIPLVSLSEISSLYLASLAAQAGLCLTWFKTLKTSFLDVAHLLIVALRPKCPIS